MPLKVPPELKKITQFVRRAEELDSESSPESRVVSYYSRQYAVQMGLPLAGSTPKAKECLAGLLSELEKDKAAMGVFSREESRMICRAFADKVFERANGPDRIGMADKSTARTFYAAATFYEILLQFYPQTVVVVGVDDDVDAKEESQIEEDEKRVYCKWKATDILKAIREGRKPVAGGYLDKEAEEVEETLVTEEESKESFEVMPSAPSFHQNKSDSEDEEAEVEVGTEVLLDSYKKDHSFNPNNNNNNNNNNKGYEFSSTALTSSSSYVEDDENNNLESSIVVVVDDNNYPIPFSEEMSQSTVQIQNDMSGGSCDDDDVSNIVSGHGLAIAEVAVDQDYSYWEWHIIKKCGPDSTSNNDIVSIAAAAECKIGLSIARNQKFYEILKGDGNATSLVLATKLMRSFGSLLNGDTVGVYVDLKSQPKSIQLYRNGVKVDDFDLKRFRGKVYPAIWLPPPDETYTIKLINREREFKHYDKTSMNNKNSANFSPLHNEHSKGGDWVV